MSDPGAGHGGDGPHARLDLEAETIAAVLDILPDPAIGFDEGMRCVALNRRAVDATRRTAEELGADAVDILVHPDDMPLVFSSFEEVLEKEVGSAIEVRIRSADDSTITRKRSVSAAAISH